MEKFLHETFLERQFAGKKRRDEHGGKKETPACDQGISCKRCP